MHTNDSESVAITSLSCQISWFTGSVSLIFVINREGAKSAKFLFLCALSAFAVNTCKIPYPSKWREIVSVLDRIFSMTLASSSDWSKIRTLPRP